eukprot:768629-Hanusia_phi.AAC.8
MKEHSFHDLDCPLSVFMQLHPCSYHAPTMLLPCSYHAPTSAYHASAPPCPTAFRIPSLPTALVLPRFRNYYPSLCSQDDPTLLDRKPARHGKSRRRGTQERRREWSRSEGPGRENKEEIEQAHGRKMEEESSSRDEQLMFKSSVSLIQQDCKV